MLFNTVQCCTFNPLTLYRALLRYVSAILTLNLAFGSRDRDRDRVLVIFVWLDLRFGLYSPSLVRYLSNKVLLLYCALWLFENSVQTRPRFEPTSRYVYLHV